MQIARCLPGEGKKNGEDSPVSKYGAESAILHCYAKEINQGGRRSNVRSLSGADRVLVAIERFELRDGDRRSGNSKPIQRLPLWTARAAGNWSEERTGLWDHKGEERSLIAGMYWADVAATPRYHWIRSSIHFSLRRSSRVNLRGGEDNICRTCGNRLRLHRMCGQ